MKCLLLTSTGDDCEHLLIILTLGSSFCRFCQGSFLGLFFPVCHRFTTLTRRFGNRKCPKRCVDPVETASHWLITSPNFCLPKSMICKIPSNFRIQTLSNHFSIHVNRLVTMEEALRSSETS